MKTLLIILSIFLILLIIVILIIKKYSKKFLNDLGFNSIKDLTDQIKQEKLNDQTETKSVSGLTNLMLPRIQKDFPDFNIEELYSKTSLALLAIFNSLENLKLSDNKELALIKDIIKEQIDDYKNSNIKVKYDDVKFHRYAIKHYKKEAGSINIIVSTSLEYYYSKMKDDKVIYSNEYKKQARYEVWFIYIYDASKFNDKRRVFGINCPNCGAAVNQFENKTCSYCGSVLKDINLKSFYIASYKED